MKIKLSTTTHKSANIQLAPKRHNFDPLLRSSIQQALENLEHKRRQAEVLARSTSYQALRTEKIGKKLRYNEAIVESGQW
jgi:hypothetical protein